MHDRFAELDRFHNRALRNEIGERLSVLLPIQEAELPDNLRQQLHRLRELDD